WPRPLVLNYLPPWPLTLSDVLLPQAVAIMLLLVLTGVALARRPMLGFLGAWFFITLAPTSSFIPIATEVGAERRMYLPLLGLMALAVTAAYWFVGRPAFGPAKAGPHVRSAAPAMALLIGIAGALAVTTFVRNREYSSALTLARTVVERRPTAVTRHYLAEQLALAGRHEEAIPHLRDAVAGGDTRAGYL